MRIAASPPRSSKPRRSAKQRAPRSATATPSGCWVSSPARRSGFRSGRASRRRDQGCGHAGRVPALTTPRAGRFFLR
jgi:hypothetical protein